MSFYNQIAEEAPMKTLDTFLEEVRSRAAKLHKVEPRVWYRGLSSRDHTLIPSLFRNPQGRPREPVVAIDRRMIEKNLFARFKTQAGELLPSGLESSWELLSVMQHYGVPTRMMDWSDSLLVALYFALEYKDSPTSPCIWILNPFELNKVSVGRSAIFDQVDRLDVDAYEIFITKDAKEASTRKAWPCQQPVATAPIWGHVRALRQRGFFTIHGTDTRPINEQEQVKHLVDQIEIPTKLHQPLRQLLKEAGLDHYSLFPDLEGLSRKLRQRYGWS